MNYRLILVLFFTIFPSLAHARSAERTDSLRTDSARQRELGEATVTATRMVLVTRGDTVIYDMDALGAAHGDMLKDMIDRMPGLEMKQGRLYYKGKVVNRLLVNGTDFQRGDTKRALDMLPAYIIKNVKAYDDLTDEAKVTGVDDGTRERVVNVVLKKQYLGTWTGNADVGQGTDHRWLYRGFANTFTERSRVSAYGGFTNTAQYQSVSDSGDWGENGGAGGSSGDTRYMLPGLSWMWTNGREENKRGYFKLDGSAEWDYRGHRDEMVSTSENFLDDGSTRTTISRLQTKNDERIYRGNFALSWQPTAWTHIDLRPSYYYTTYDSRDHKQEGQWNCAFTSADGYASPLDSLLKYAAAGWPMQEGEASTLLREESQSHKGQHVVSNYLYFTQRLSENNWRISLRSTLYYASESQDEHNLQSYTSYQQTSAQLDPLYNRFTTTALHVLNLQNYLDLDIPLPVFQTLRLTYGSTISRNHSNARAYRLERLGGDFAEYDAYLAQLGLLPTTDGWQLAARDPDQTLNSLTLSRRQQLNASLVYHKKGLTLNAQSQLAWVYDRIDYLKGDYQPLHPERRATDYNLQANLRYETDSVGTFTLNYGYSVTPTSLLQTITLPDNSNPLYISRGNPDLHNLHTNSLSVGYEKNFKHGQLFMTNLRLNKTTNNVISRQSYDKQTGVTTSDLTNLGQGGWSLSPDLTFSTPLDRKQRVSLSLSNYYNFQSQPAYAVATQGSPVLYGQHSHMVYLSQAINARFGKFVGTVSNTLYLSSTQSANPKTARATSLMETLAARLQYTLPWNMELKSSVESRYQRNGKASIARPWHTVWNVSVSQPFLRSKSLVVKAEVSDLLNQRETTWNYVSTDTRFYGTSASVGRFFMFHLIYRFSTAKDNAR